jgi:peroxiredoxin
LNTKDLFAMARTPSNMLPLGTEAPDFILQDTVSEKFLSLNDIKGEIGCLIVFICNHCPYVKHINPTLARLAQNYQGKGIAFVAISSNDIIGYPEDSPELMRQTAKKEGFSFPYLYDETQEVARAYNAACTPDFYLFNAELQLVYRGQMDDSRPGNEIPVTGADLELAIGNLLAGKPVSSEQKPSLGCNIKWKNFS